MEQPFEKFWTGDLIRISQSARFCYLDVPGGGKIQIELDRDDVSVLITDSSSAVVYGECAVKYEKIDPALFRTRKMMEAVENMVDGWKPDEMRAWVLENCKEQYLREDAENPKIGDDLITKYVTLAENLQSEGDY